MVRDLGWRSEPGSGHADPTWLLDLAEAAVSVWLKLACHFFVNGDRCLAPLGWVSRIMVTISTAATMAWIAIQDWPVFSCVTGSHAVISGLLVTLPALTVRAFSAAGQSYGCPVGSWEDNWERPSLPIVIETECRHAGALSRSLIAPARLGLGGAQ